MTEASFHAAAAKAVVVYVTGDSGGLAGGRRFRGVAVLPDGNVIRGAGSTRGSRTAPPWWGLLPEQLPPATVRAALPELLRQRYWSAGACPPRRLSVATRCSDCVSTFFSVTVRGDSSSRTVSCHGNAVGGGCHVVIEERGKPRERSCSHDAPAQGWSPFFLRLQETLMRTLLAR